MKEKREGGMNTVPEDGEIAWVRQWRGAGRRFCANDEQRKKEQGG